MTVADEKMFRPLPPEQAADALEREVLAQWSAEGILAQTDAARAGAPEFVFFEGPPTANGRPGIHHVFSRTLKDLFCRHRVMSGYHVTRKAGWDTHGLPVEIEVEKQLARRMQDERGMSDESLKRITGKQLIEEFGVEEFNQLCRASVFTYKDVWEQLSERIGYWLDYSDPYVTYTNEYIESVWWSLSRLHAKQLLYRGHKILPYCARCGTALSSHEVAQGYKDVKDPSIFLALELLPEQSAVVDRQSPESSASRIRYPAPGTKILVWTTTPWTLVSNTALAVNAELIYLELVRRKDGERVLLAEARAPAVLGDDFTDRWEVAGRHEGRSLTALRYRRPLDWVEFGEGAHEIIIAESFVSSEDGTGVVHISPAFGADDYGAGKRHGLAFVQPVNGRGEFPAPMPIVGGLFVKQADAPIIEALRKRGVLWKAGTLEHSYPHCWRCGTPLLYYARDSWFVRTTAYRDAMLARNARVNWNPPEVGAGRFGEWLENNIDWALSRDRYWGTPLPVWVCDRDSSHVVAIGGYAELARQWGKPLPADFDPHKPYIDRYEWPCVACAGVAGREPGADTALVARDSGPGTMRRVPEVIDAWYDSGSMPFAQWHYPFENADVINRQYPADFIAEGLDQTRGWFYSMLAIAAGLGDALPHNVTAEGTDALAAPYRAVVVNNLVLDADGVKMSKHLGNTVDPFDVTARYGADAVRLFLMASSQVWLPRRFDEKKIGEVAGRFLLTLKNIYSGMFAEYANFGWSPSDADPAPADRPPVDRWILSRLSSVEREAHRALNAFDAYAAAWAVMKFVDDDVSKWYVRRTRARFYDVDTDDNRAAFATLHEVLVVACRLLAPFCPFVTDWLHRELTGTSVHLAPYSRIEDRASSTADGGDQRATLRDPDLERRMDDLRTLVTLGHAARDAAEIKVRQPLARLVCVVPGTTADAFAELVPLLAAELNVKRVDFVSSGDELVRLTAKPNFRTIGKRFGKSTKTAAEAIAALPSDAIARMGRGEPLAISVDGADHILTADDLEVIRHAAGDLVVESKGGYFAAIDGPSGITPELRQEGMARELVSRVQRMRKEAGFAVSDRIALAVSGDEMVERAAEEHRGYLMTETLATELTIGGATASTVHHAMQAVDLDGLAAHIALTRVG
ncbi:MAG: isoleucine--tRNA ligase [Gemmatimonadaceae bacterium]